MASKSVSVQEVFDAGPFTGFQLLVSALCFFCTFLDGFDLTVIGVAVPKIADYLHVKPTALGLAMSAGQFGPLIGAAFLGMLADRWGRKKMLITCSLIFGIFTVLCAFITNVGQLALFRFIAGLAMGGTVPTAIAFGCEYAPSRARATLATTMYAGVPFGATLVGFAAMYLLPRYGWQSLFIFGGTIPIIISLLMATFLPESLGFLVQRGKSEAKIRAAVAKVRPAMARDLEIEFYSTEKKLKGVPVKHLFTEGRGFTTALLWVAFFLGYYLIYMLLSWAPTLLKKSGASVTQYALAFALINLGAGIATVAAGRLMDKSSNPFRVIQIGFVLGFVSLTCFGIFASSPFLVIAALSIICGMFINGSATSLVAVASVFYPIDARSTGIGWAYAIGRAGATVAPAVGGVLITLNWGVARICSSNAVLALVAAAIMIILHRHRAAAARLRGKPVPA